MKRYLNIPVVLILRNPEFCKNNSFTDLLKFRSRGSVVGIEAALLAGRFGVRIPVGTRKLALPDSY